MPVLIRDYTHELWRGAAEINRLPSYQEPLAHILSQSLVRDGQNESFAVTKKIAAYHEQTPVDIAPGHDVTSPVTVDMVARPAGLEPATL